MTTDSKIVLIGLPATGKSTFLGALWSCAEAENTKTSLKVDILGENDTHLNKLSASWISCKEPGRTRQMGEGVVTMSLVETEGSRKVKICFPDLEGEGFERQWVYRQCEKRYFDLARDADGVLLFIHPAKVRDAGRIEEFLELAGPPPQTEQDGAKKDSSAKQETPERKPEQDPTQVILVELLQFLVNLPFPRRRLKVAIIVSAWDTVSKQQDGPGEKKQNPTKWLEQRLPALSQFINTNKDWLTSQVYGVSAQGGSYEDSIERVHLRDEVPQAVRPIVVLDEFESKDLTLPIKWLMT